MNIDIKDRITLDDNNVYVVASKINYQDKTYYYLMDINNNENIIFCYEDIADKTLVESTNVDLNKTLLPLFFQAGKKHIDDIDIDKHNNDKE